MTRLFSGISAFVLVLVYADPLGLGSDGAAAEDYPVRPIPFTEVELSNGFWASRLETNRKVTLPFDFEKCEATGRIANFDRAAGLLEGPFEGYRFNDSDLFKVIEGAAYSLAIFPDPELDAYLDRIIAKIAAAQEEDGYLYTARTVDPEHPADGAGPERWSNTRDAHELYNVGHLYEAAVAHYQATKKRSLLEVALKNADLICSVFGPSKRRDAPGHQEIEIGLVKLYRLTGKKEYLDLAYFFLEERGRSEGGRPLYGEYCQDHLPVVDQREAVGHAVRAGYLYAAMADAAALLGERRYIGALDAIWENVVRKKLYLTGGIGARHQGEAFGEDFELPNATAYNETCAAIANMLWNHRLFLLKGDGKYIDVLERTLYNGFLSGVSLGGDAFFYPNPLSASLSYKFNQGTNSRRPWFGCSCCPANVVRFLPSLPGYLYARQEGIFFVNLFAESKVSFTMGGTAVALSQETDYPWDGRVRIALEPENPATFTLFIRIPGWAHGQPVPGDLYRYEGEPAPPVSLTINGRPVPLNLDAGFARLHRTFKKQDLVELTLPMPVRSVFCRDEVEANRGRFALERGPLVYCVEGADNAEGVHNLLFDPFGAFTTEVRPELLGGLTLVRGEARIDEGGTEHRKVDFTAIPYYAWCHRGENDMTVWLPYEDSRAEPREKEQVGQ